MLTPVFNPLAACLCFCVLDSHSFIVVQLTECVPTLWQMHRCLRLIMGEKQHEPPDFSIAEVIEAMIKNYTIKFKTASAIPAAEERLECQEI